MTATVIGTETGRAHLGAVVGWRGKPQGALAGPSRSSITSPCPPRCVRDGRADRPARGADADFDQWAQSQPQMSRCRLYDAIFTRLGPSMAQRHERGHRTGMAFNAKNWATRSLPTSSPAATWPAELPMGP